MEIKHNWNYFDSDDKIFVLTSKKDHEIFYYYKNQIVDDINLANIIVKILGESEQLEYQIEEFKEDRLVTTLPMNVEFLTKSQRELARTDWMVIRELEKLLPDSNETRILRDRLRLNVDSEIRNK